MTVHDRLKYGDFWVTADRRFMYFYEMSTSHLNNTIAMLQRMAPDLQAYAETNLRFSFYGKKRMHPGMWLNQQPAFQGLIKERKRRKVDEFII